MVTFGQYLRQWFKAAFKPAYDIVGGLGLGLSATVWAWHRFGPESFSRAAKWIGISQEAAMSDLAWEIPLAIGSTVFLYRVLRAPYEIYLTQASSIDTLKREVSDARSYRSVAAARNIQALIELQRAGIRIRDGIERRGVRWDDDIKTAVKDWENQVGDSLRNIVPEMIGRFLSDDKLSKPPQIEFVTGATHAFKWTNRIEHRIRNLQEIIEKIDADSKLR